MPPQLPPGGGPPAGGPPSVVVDRGRPGAAAGPCVKLEIVPIAGRPGAVPGPPGAAGPPVTSGPGGMPPPAGGPSQDMAGQQQYALRCFRANSAQPDTAMAANPDDLMRLISQALGLPDEQPDNTPEDMTTESATAPAA